MSGTDPIPDWVEPFRNAYQEAFGFELLYADPAGRVILGKAEERDCTCRGQADHRRAEAAAQTLYWGETIINTCCDDGYAMWSVPVTCNDKVIANLTVQGVEIEVEGKEESAHIQNAADSLLEWALRDNLIPSSAVELSRQRAESDQNRFYALEQSQQFASDDLRSHYLREEPELLSTIKQSNIGEARAILNRILVNIYSLSGQRMDLLKSCVLELVVMMSRAAVEAGADPSVLLGTNYRSLSELSEIDDEEDLARWVTQMLETLIDAIRTNDDYPHSLLISKALSYMREHLGENLRRDEVAQYAGVSPGHFTAVMTERMGRSFSEMLLQMRVDRAKELLRATRFSLSTVAQECGFYDQSHLNKIFRKATGKSPGEFRKQYRNH